MKEKETATIKVDEPFVKLVDRELRYSLLCHGSSRDHRFCRTPYDKIWEEGNLNAEYFKEQFDLITRKQSTLSSAARIVVIYEIRKAYYAAIKRLEATKKDKEAKQ